MSESTPPFNNEVLSVATLNRLVRDCLEAAFPLLWVGGEISNLTYASSGHVYFSLKDGSAQVRCVMWRSRAQLLGWRVENGQKVEARALVSFYEPRGEFQLTIEAVRKAGQGDLFERFLRLKAQLENEGLFAIDRKRPLPAFPRHIGIVTSLQAAALRDVLSTLRRRAPQLHVTIFPCPVQGDSAGEKIAAALTETDGHGVDAIILCRGGGSLEDLWAFNEEAVARAIRACRVPVISGVGHETDFTIADFTADLRAPTPTAAAELVCPERAALLAQLVALHSRLARSQTRHLAQCQQQLDWLTSRLTHPAQKLRQQGEALADLRRRLGLALGQQNERRQQSLVALGRHLQQARPQPARLQMHLKQLQQQLDTQIRWQHSLRQTKLNALSGGLKQLDPLAVLRRGYALAVDADGRCIRDAAQLKAGDRINLSFASGKAAATVNQVVAKPEAD
ncbi:exodeoxyribonuclease VII large subunit [Dechloromonas sp.]|uniref:exodeoxyribonuclease VII large subunit n=1 Tax=Dechloromonas sp. TaxID=1917218 RepID=UPI001215C8C6|nr:exodeoxyribonuclease VII large subunit [Dechloromonas sp.]MBU3695529.1 exodeoxyribonuclease VII large subunit [Dechloromonas sp.]TEX48931.1 MAG: exodeoxyribonuclease VII large subunit [Rhodocyclaceae bacterium]